MKATEMLSLMVEPGILIISAWQKKMNQVDLWDSVSDMPPMSPSKTQHS